MPTKEIDCPIWGNEHKATLHHKQERHEFPVTRDDLIESPRTGGMYRMETEAFVWIYPSRLNSKRQMMLTKWIYNQRKQGEGSPLVTREIVHSFVYSTNTSTPSTSKRAEMLLRYLRDRTKTIGDRLPFEKFGEKILIVSESLEWREVSSLLEYLSRKGFVESRTIHNPPRCAPVITAEGHMHIEESAMDPNSDQAFVAMWFNQEMDSIYDNGIAPAIEASGFKPYRVDREHYLGKIDDQIIAEIRQSRFLIADMTHGDDGARGSVYFEAGFALGLNIPVIYTCRKDMFNKLHFDTRQYPHIDWTNEDIKTFRQNLENKIRATVV